MVLGRCFLTASWASLGLLLAHNHAGVAAFGMTMSASSETGRRGFLGRVASATVAATVGLSSSSGILAPPPALAVGGLNKVNAKLQAYGLPGVQAIDGLTPLLDVYGKGGNRFPLLVTFSHPLDWVVTKPSNDANGEDGTIQAGEYAKGDTATLFVYTDPGNVKDIASQPKSFFENAVIKAISQKGNNVYQNFKISKVEPTTQDGRDYVLVDFKYELLTGAGFEVDRVGVASITSQGAAVEVLWTATIRQRYKKLEPTLRNIAGSFRCWADGLNFSNDLIAPM